MTIRVRIAPSPTGPLHVGTARSALFNFVFAKKHGGDFILRIDDTDTDRSKKEFEDDIREALVWLHLSPDEIIRQSERTAFYTKYLTLLHSQKKIFWCAHTEKDLAKERNEQVQARGAPRHRCDAYRDGKGGEQEGSILRFRNDATEPVLFNDEIRGEISFDPTLLGDFSVAKNFTSPLYNFATALDDALMNITHVIRGEDHIPNTPKQILLRHALGAFPHMRYAHLPLILGKDKSKLSKRHGATAITQYRKEGYLAEAMQNFLALLGWHPKKAGNPPGSEEIFSLEQFTSLFILPDAQKGGAIFDPEKLKWMNGVYIRNMSTTSLASTLIPFVKQSWRKRAEKRPAWWLAIVSLEHERLVTLEEINGHIDYFFEEPMLKKELLYGSIADTEKVPLHLACVTKTLQALAEGDFSEKNISKAVLPYAESHGKKDVLWPFRVALTGKKASPGLFEIAALLGKDTVLKRLTNAIETLSI